MAKKKKKRLKKSVIYTFVGLCFVSLLILGINLIKPKKTKTENTTKKTESYLTDDEIKEILSNDSMEFNMGDFKIPQGDQIVVTTNSQESEGLIFSSNNEDVVIIENDGTLTAVAPGTAAITVTQGNISKSIVVEVIEDAKDLGVNDLPIYTEAQKVVIETGESTFEPVTQPVKEPETQVETENSKSTERSTEQNDTSGNYENVNPTQNITQAVTKETTNNYVEETKSEVDNATGLTSEELYDYLPELGLEKRVSNAYVYTVGEDYIGQVILESKCIHIYVKSNSTGFENILQSVLKLVIPLGYDNVLKTFETATADKALIVSGRKIQIIVGNGEKHKQLIIYN